MFKDEFKQSLQKWAIDVSQVSVLLIHKKRHLELHYESPAKKISVNLSHIRIRLKVDSLVIEK